MSLKLVSQSHTFADAPGFTLEPPASFDAPEMALVE
jgi:hypothetical protein